MIQARHLKLGFRSNRILTGLWRRPSKTLVALALSWVCQMSFQREGEGSRIKPNHLALFHICHLHHYIGNYPCSQESSLKGVCIWGVGFLWQLVMLCLATHVLPSQRWVCTSSMYWMEWRKPSITTMASNMCQVCLSIMSFWTVIFTGQGLYLILCVLCITQCGPPDPYLSLCVAISLQKAIDYMPFWLTLYS